jgi:hypothetical protein
VNGNRLEFMKIVQATPEDQLLDVCKTHCYLPISSSLSLAQLCGNDEKNFPEGYRYSRAELVEQARAAKHHQHHSITSSGGGGHEQPKELFWWYVFAVVDQFYSCRMKQTESIKFPIHPLLHGANSVVCLHYDFPLGKLVSPSRGPTYVYADHLFPVWELDYSAPTGSQLDIGDRYRFIQARFTSDVNKNSLGPIQRLLQEEETKQQQQQPTATVGQKRKSPPPTTANEDEPQPPAYDPDSAPLPKKPPTKKPKFGSAVSSRTTQVTLDGKMTFTVQEGKTAALVRMPSTTDEEEEEEEEGEDMDATEEYRPNKHGQTAEEDYRVGWNQFGSMA